MSYHLEAALKRCFGFNIHAELVVAEANAQADFHAVVVAACIRERSLVRFECLAVLLSAILDAALTDQRRDA